jgi:hypothetical protein
MFRVEQSGCRVSSLTGMLWYEAVRVKLAQQRSVRRWRRRMRLTRSSKELEVPRLFHSVCSTQVKDYVKEGWK